MLVHLTHSRIILFWRGHVCPNISYIISCRNEWRKKLLHAAKREPAFIFSQHSYSFWKSLQQFTSVFWPEVCRGPNLLTGFTSRLLQLTLHFIERTITLYSQHHIYGVHCDLILRKVKILTPAAPWVEKLSGCSWNLSRAAIQRYVDVECNWVTDTGLVLYILHKVSNDAWSTFWGEMEKNPDMVGTNSLR